MSANLTFYILEGTLTGLAAGHQVNIDAWSGGGGGSTKHAGNADTNNPAAQAVKAVEKGPDAHRGGPIPAGRYRIRTPSRRAHLGLCAELDPYDREQEKHMYGRGGFFIHGRGPMGSDGCIVPKSSFHELMAWLEKDRGGVLVVRDRLDPSSP